MLIDIFSRRYEKWPLRDSFEQRDSRVLVQAFRILADDIYPYYRNGKENPANVAFWTGLHSNLSRELGVQELSPLSFSYSQTCNGNNTVQVSKNPLVKVCETWLMKTITETPDLHIKERLSLIELGFREREREISAMNASAVADDAQLLLSSLHRRNLPPLAERQEAARQERAMKTEIFRANVDELNARFRHATYPLNYHNGFIQASTDNIVQDLIEAPFWQLVAEPLWANVDLDMKQALDLRDSDGPDPAFYAARALESAIKIISDKKGWTYGREYGASNYTAGNTVHPTISKI